MDIAEISNSVRAKLQRDLDNFQSELFRTLGAFKNFQNHYRNSMRIALDRTEYFVQGDLWQLHQRIKNEEFSKVCPLIAS